MNAHSKFRGAIGAVALAASLSACSAAAPEGGADQPAAAPDSPAHTLVARSVAFHDPSGVWGARPIAMSWAGTDSEGGERVAVDLDFGTDPADFALSGRYRGMEIEYETSADAWSASVGGVAEPELDEETRTAMRLHREDGMFWRSYYGYLAGLPMKIVDPGAHLDPEVIETTFMDQPVQAVRVTYDPDVGSDIWYFYFDPETAELVGCRFFHDEAANDGEYIVFEGLEEGGGLKLPRERSWYFNTGDEYLGTDQVRSIEVGS